MHIKGTKSWSPTNKVLLDTYSPAQNGKSKPGNAPGMSVHGASNSFIAALGENKEEEDQLQAHRSSY